MRITKKFVVFNKSHVRLKHDARWHDRGMPLEAWSGKKIHTFDCLVQYLKIGLDKDKRSDKFASRIVFSIFLGMPKTRQPA